MKLLRGILWVVAVILPAGARVLEEMGTYGVAGFQHGNALSEIVCLSDGKRVLSSSREETLRLWDLESGRLLRAYPRPGMEATWGIRLLPGEKEFLVAGSSGEVIRYDLASGEVVKVYQHDERAYRLDLHPDGKRFVGTYDEGTAILWDLETGEQTHSYTGHDGSVYTAIISDDGRTLITGSEDGTFKSWDLEKGTLIETHRAEGKRAKYGDIYTLAKSPDGSRFAMVSDDKYVRVFEFKTMVEIWKTKLRDNGQVVAWSPDGTMLATASDDGNLYLLKAADGEVLRKIPVERNSHTPITFSTDGERIISGGDQIVYLHKVESGERILPTLGVPLHLGGFDHIAVAGGMLMLGGGSELHVWDTGEPGKLRQFEEASDISKMVLSADGKLLAVGGESGKISIRETEGFAIVNALNSGDSVRALAFMHDGKKLLSAGDDERLTLWDLESGRKIRGFAKTGEDLNDLVLSPDGKIAVTTGVGQNVRVFELATGKQLSSFKIKRDGVLSLASLNEGRSLLVASDHEKLWGRLLPRLAEETGLDEEEIKRFLEKLAERDFKQRQEATDSLVAMGPDVIKILNRLSLDDPEVRSRVKEISGAIQALHLSDGLKEIHTFDGHFGSLESDPLGRFFAGTEGWGVNAKLVVGEIVDEKVQVRDSLSLGHGAAELAFAPDGRHLATVNSDGTCSLFSVRRD